jgi:folate-binding protein YgfZ
MAGQGTDLDGFVRLPNRAFLRLSGEDRLKFLQGLVSNDVNAAAPGRAVYSCLLTPQGKFLHDFFLIADGDSLLIECEADRRADLVQRLKMYRLRSRIELTEVDYAVFAAFGVAPLSTGEIIYSDPREPALGKRVLLPPGENPEPEIPFDAYDRLRISLAVPDGSRDMEIGKAILLENNIDLLNGIAWDKGCYTGQELTARTRYRGLIKKRLIPVRIAGKAPPIGTPLIEAGSEVGEMRGACGDLGLALLRLERLRRAEAIQIDGATLMPEPPPALAATIAQPEA